ncbi:MAG: hypothetical protein GY801_45695 [bacterium]|nr:hypothetical protein [bacterium]
MKKVVSVGILTVTLVCLLHSPGLALTDEELFQSFTFNFLTPGARATALGGAFIGLADDATAVESNPAGLTQLYDPEFSIEYKHISHKENRPYENLNYDNPSIEKREFSNFVNSLPFLSAAFPYTLRSEDEETGEEREIVKFVFSLYRQELVNYATSFKTSQAPLWIPGSGGIYESPRYFFPVSASADLSVTNYGVGIALEFPFLRGLSLAVSPRLSELEIESTSIRYDADLESTPDIIEATDFRESEIENWTTIDDKDSGFSINAGLLWRLERLEEMLHVPRFSIGAVYRAGAEFKVKEVLSWSLLPTQQYSSEFSDFEEFTLKIPDSFGGGIAIKPRDNLTFTLDVVHVQYEDLLEDFDIIFSAFTSEQNFTVDNATEIHFGMEYEVEMGERLLFLRAGIYNDPDHSIRFTGTTEGKIREKLAPLIAQYENNPSSLALIEDYIQDQTQAYDNVGKSLFPGGEEQIHLTGGIGLILNEHLEINTGINLSEYNNQLSVTGVYRF